MGRHRLFIWDAHASAGEKSLLYPGAVNTIGVMRVYEDGDAVVIEHTAGEYWLVSAEAPRPV